MSKGIHLLLNGARGIYIPRDAVEFLQDDRWGGFDKLEHFAELEDPENDWYWEAWDSIMRKATYVDEEGDIWSLHQDGDLWAVCDDLMTDREFYDFYHMTRNGYMRFAEDPDFKENGHED